MTQTTMAKPTGVGAAKTGTFSEKLQHAAGAFLAYFALSTAFIVAVLPFLWVIMSSLKTNASIFMEPFSLPDVAKLHLENYPTAWHVGHFGTYFQNSVIVAVPTVLLILFCGSLAGFAFGRLDFPGRNAIFYLFLASQAISTNSIMIPLYHVVFNLGLSNNLLAVILPTVGSHMPLSSFLMRSFFRGLPKELEDAARIDGASDFGVFWHVMLPLARPALFALAIFSFMDSWNAFLLPLLFLQVDELRTIPIGLRAFQGLYQSEYPLMFAGITISFIPTLIVYFLLQRHFQRGLTVGSITG